MVRSRRRTSPWLLAAIIGPAAVLLAGAADVDSQVVTRAAAPAVVTEPPCCFELVPLPVAFASSSSAGPADVNVTTGQLVSASRLRVVRPDVHELLPAGVAPEQGLQVRTILTARSISAVFPEIHSIGGVRADALRWHPNGLALDVMIPNSGSRSGIALGNQIVSYVLQNASRFGIQDAIWRGVYYTPQGPQGFDAGHYDHVHVTTTGGGYPRGGESYVRLVSGGSTGTP